MSLIPSHSQDIIVQVQIVAKCSKECTAKKVNKDFVEFGHRSNFNSSIITVHIGKALFQAIRSKFLFSQLSFSSPEHGQTGICKGLYLAMLVKLKVCLLQL